MKLRRVRLAAFCSLTIALQVGAHATPLIDHGAYTTDSVSGLDWLDISYTRGRSYNQVSAMISGGNLNGWRFATNADFDTLMLNVIGAPYSAGYSPSQRTQLTNLVDLMGPTFAGSDYGYVVGFVHSAGLPMGDARQFGYDDVDGGYIRPTQDYGWDESFYATSHQRGAFLVRGRPVHVPEPGTIALLALGFMGLWPAAVKNKPEQQPALVRVDLTPFG